MRHYECECLRCGGKNQIGFCEEPYSELEDVFNARCPACGYVTKHQRVLTKKAIAEKHRKEQEQRLRDSIVDKCSQYGFQCRFLYQSVIITTPLSDWCFDYHVSRITLYHESTTKINWATGNYAKAHIQFNDRKISPLEVIGYIAAHDAWRMKQKEHI